MRRADGLPPIRAELRLVGRRHDASGHDVGIVYDPLRHRFFEIGARVGEILTHWRTGTVSRLNDRVVAAGHHPVQRTEIDAILLFLQSNQLLALSPATLRPSLLRRVEMLIGTLFFFRIPLCHPDRVLTGLGEWLFPVLGRRVLAGFILTAVLGLALVVRQWDQFLDGVRPAANIGGAASFIAAIVLAKAVHELGHALAAKRLGCAVPTMGIALMFGAPLLYTDLSDTWRLSRRRDRLLVASGGILAELGLAALATWGWLILPDGPARGACLFLATAAWLATLVINANPFLRFDGYFILSDLLGLPNLQERAFAEGRRMLRRLLWGSREPPAEDLPRRMAWGILVYAYATWIFRGLLYSGLAWTVFTLLPKLIAVPLLVSELWVLLMRPVVNELSLWWRHRRSLLASRRARLTLFLAGGAFLLLLIPQSFRMELPAVRTPMQRQWIHPPRPAQLIFHVADGTEVAAGDVLATFADPGLDHEIAQSRLRLASLTSSEQRAARTLASARDLAVLGERIAGETATLSGLLEQRDTLTVRAGFAGRILESASGLRNGGWHAPASPLFLLASSGTAAITAFVDDRDLGLVAVAAPATFHPTAIDLPVVPAIVTRVESVPSEFIAEPLLASISGGPIATGRDSADRAIPRQGQYRVTSAATADPDAGVAAAIPGRLMVASRPYSLLALAARRLQALLVKEASG